MKTLHTMHREWTEEQIYIAACFIYYYGYTDVRFNNERFEYQDLGRRTWYPWRNQSDSISHATAVDRGMRSLRTRADRRQKTIETLNEWSPA